MSAPTQRQVRLSFGGNDLDPASITSKLCGEPTRAVRIDDPVEAATGLVGQAQKNLWERRVNVGNDPNDLSAAITGLFDGLTSDLEVWSDLTARHGGMVMYNIPDARDVDGAGLDHSTLAAISNRGLGFVVSVFYRPVLPKAR